jgi:FKBP-type peptidyl-prolyl cis-trans isomerase FklB
MTEKECQAAMVELQQIQMSKIANKNKREGATFLADNAKKEGVKTLPSGLQYKVIREGKGATPRSADAVTTHYRGTFLDGAEFDSSYRRNEPATFPVKGVIKGWTEALQLMKVGDKWQLYVPSDLAYGPQGRDEIPPNATLIFDIELLDVKPAAADGTLPKPNE